MPTPLKQLVSRATMALRVQSTFFKIVEPLSGLAAGAYIGAVVSGVSVKGYAIGFGILFAVTQVIKFTVDKIVGESIIDELWSQHELEVQCQVAERNSKNFHRIKRAVKNLNESTCAIEQTCVAPFDQYIGLLLDPFFDN